MFTSAEIFVSDKAKAKSAKTAAGDSSSDDDYNGFVAMLQLFHDFVESINLLAKGEIYNEFEHL